jgi:hypothetical protein
MWAAVGDLEIDVSADEKEDDADEMNKAAKILSTKFYERHLVAPAPGRNRKFNLAAFNREIAVHKISPLVPPNTGMPFRRAACEEWAIKHIEANRNAQAKKK